MKNLFYIDYCELKNLKNHDTPIGVVIDLLEVKLDKFNEFMLNLVRNSYEQKIEKVIVKMDCPVENLNKVDFHSNNIYYMFYNEDDIREEISLLDDDSKKKIIGVHPCSTGVEVLRYRIIGISNIFVESPFINDNSQLAMLERIGYNIFAIPNYNNNFGVQIDSNWIRPEGIDLYPNVNNWLLMCSRSMNINSILNAYLQQRWLGDIDDFLVNYHRSFNTHKNKRNMLSPTFDIKRSLCKADCINCKSCEREFDLSSKISTRLEQKNNL